MFCIAYIDCLRYFGVPSIVTALPSIAALNPTKSSLFYVKVPVLSQNTYSMYANSSYRFNDLAFIPTIDFVSGYEYIIHASSAIHLAEKSFVISILIINYSGTVGIRIINIESPP